MLILHDTSFDLPFDEGVSLYVVFYRGKRIPFELRDNPSYFGPFYRDSLCFATRSKAFADSFISDKKDFFYKQIYLYD